ncbi:N-acetylmuramoyl-L-alanine amidase [Aeromicrobium ginsengisoli]|uniref:Peptidoglycan recognition protein family domain-containing protein n=1 Tax=Aeromicrobium ginsengisoli TaxID=363867 RepID=A0A5M4FE61_9ACTN|nr:N-acetylmuramoyl-L-alanine amidase [Aeromicrobium ginsengisoli]KAA1397519.1 hypothetical protein ESP70_009085 [Aeromicrobium ginsengisoli]
MRPFISGTIAALAVLATISAPAHAEDTQARPKADPVDIATTRVPAVSDTVAQAAERADDDAADLVAQLPARRTDDFGLVGVTWARGFDDRGMTVQVRLRTDGAWAGWEELDVESDEGEGGRDGTEPLWAGSADGVAVRVTSPTGQRPSGLTVSTIDPGSTPAQAVTASNAFYDAAGDDAVTTVADGSPTYTPKPAIISRSAWGAKKNTYCDAPRTGSETRGVVVHHTAGTNTYTKAQSAGIVRAVQAYHMSGRDWCDIGYNFLVDKYGQIFEGRNGGVDKPVRGAHAGNKSVNTYTMGVSMMGTFTSTQPTDATKDAMVKLIGWRLGTTFHAAKGKYTLGGVVLDRIAGHRDVVSTACPGQAAYEWLSASGGLRDRVEDYIANYTSPIKTKVIAMGRATTGPVYVGEYPFTTSPTGRKARLGRLDMYSTTTYGTFSVGGSFRDGYNASGAQAGRLGVPIANHQSTPVSSVTLQRFARGTVYRVQRGSVGVPYFLYGKIEDRYVAIGEATSSLGAPRSSMSRLSNGAYRAYFAHGSIVQHTNGVVSVYPT